MRNFLFLFFAVLLCFNTGSSFSQPDEPYFIYKEGAKIKIGHFNKRKIATGYTVYTVTEVIKTDSINYLTLLAETQDRYHKSISSKVLNASYFDGEIVIDKLFLIPIDSLVKIPNHYEINGRDFVIPAFLANGIALSSAWVEVVSESNNHFKISEYSRIVDSFEKVKTNIGEFDACVIASKIGRASCRERV